MTISWYLLFSNQEFTDKTDFTFRKVWQNSGGNVEWPNGQEITVKLYSSKTDPAKESERTLVSTVVLKNTNVVSQTPEISGAEWEYLTVDNVTAFKIKNLPRFASDTDLTPLIYAVEEDQVAGYLTPGYTDADGELPAVPVNNTCAKDGMRIVNAQEGGVELPNTGGPGTLGFTVLGTSLCLSAGALTVKNEGRMIQSHNRELTEQ